LGIALAASFAATAHPSDSATLKKNLAAWQPTEIAQKDDQITVALPAAEITSEVYSFIISSGVCTPLWTKDAPTEYLKGIKQINMTNKFKAVGYSFENPLSVCKEMGDLMEKPAAALMLGNTHIYKIK
jgi:hypothetical protein